jgi:TetR/AcrR family transcriptional repressor of nem operon
MRYEADHKAKTRRRIVKNAARQIRAKGLAGPGVATVMKASGLTVGGFYKHFASRDDLLAQAVEEGLSDFGGKLMAAVSQAPPAGRWKEIVKWYLTLDHCEHCDTGCPVAALAPEIARASPAVKKRVAGIMKERRARLTALMPGKTLAEQEKNFIVIFSAMAGAVAVARIMPDPSERRAILTSVRDHLLHSF